MPKPARTVKSQVLRPLAEPVATVPRREGFEGGQTSGVKGVETQPIVPEPAGNGEKPSFEAAEPVATVPRREGFEGGQTSGLKAVKTQPIVPEPAGNGEKPSFEAASRASGNRTPPGRV